ncbi:phytanoyl-CoA dioxygenase [Thozetella sp. PMI_491]|nr:phytanoyl-CoA dioxygenase [Thozetella sp. PMI_491]
MSLPVPPTKPRARSKLTGWRADLQKNGYCVVKGAIPLNRAVQYQEAAYTWLKSFDTPLDFSDPSTWVKENLPVQSKINTFHGYCVAHEKFMWDARQEPGVLNAFAELWGTRELLASFDSLNVTLPNRRDIPRKGAWEHIDQSPLRRGLHCVQGIINLSPAGPEDGGLVVYPGSHLLNDEFFDTKTDSKDWKPLDRFMFDDAQLRWFEERGCRPLKVCADVGDLILWDSRTIHYGAEPTERSTQIRTVIYAAYTPARLASPEQMALKKQVFESFGGTTNWPHDNIVARSTETLLEDGTRDPKDRDRPLNMPELTDQLLKLAGAKPY